MNESEKEEKKYIYYQSNIFYTFFVIHLFALGPLMGFTEAYSKDAVSPCIPVVL